jgi:type III restriction enzyme
MFRDHLTQYEERVDIIGNKAFMQFVDDLDREEELELESFQVGKDKLTIMTIQPDPAKLEKDIAIPHLSSILTRKKTLSEEIASLDVQSLSVNALPKKQGTSPSRPSDTRDTI